MIMFDKAILKTGLLRTIRTSSVTVFVCRSVKCSPGDLYKIMIGQRWRIECNNVGDQVTIVDGGRIYAL